MSPPEVALWRQLRLLKARGWHFRRQSPEPPFTLDFVCRKAKLVVEVDGLHHAGAEQSERDAKRDAFLQARGFRILRFWARDIEVELDRVVETILNELGENNELSRRPGRTPGLRGGHRYRGLVRLGLRRREDG